MNCSHRDAASRAIKDETGIIRGEVTLARLVLDALDEIAAEWQPEDICCAVTERAFAAVDALQSLNAGL